MPYFNKRGLGGEKMEEYIPFLQMVQFFHRQPISRPGSSEYNSAFCNLLSTASSADAASIWQIDSENQLQLIFSTDIPKDRIMDITLGEGEGIGGAAALSRKTIFVVNAQKQSLHDSRVDERFGIRTYAMVSSPILFEDQLFGVMNILNIHSEKAFAPEWKEWLSALAVMYGAAVARAERSTPDRVFLMKEMDGKPPQAAEGKTVIVGVSRAVQEALHLCLKAAKTDIPVLVYGETGTGKELAARRIHEASPRKQGPFLEVNCAALSETLLESELFGHVKGAFTGATHDRSGKFVAASGGTLFLDEIGEMSVTCQAKILRALEEKKVTPLGSEVPVPTDARIIAATNQDLTAIMNEKKFREDLYYRLCGIEIIMPPLRERVEDIHLLALHFLNKARMQQETLTRHERPLRLSSETLELLTMFNWPGNVRQLEQAIFAAAALAEGDEIIPTNLPGWLHKAIKLNHPLPPVPERPYSDAQIGGQEERQPLPAEERARYLKALNSTRYLGTGRWNVSAAARELGIPRETLAYRLRKSRISF